MAETNSEKILGWKERWDSLFQHKPGQLSSFQFGLLFASILGSIVVVVHVTASMCLGISDCWVYLSLGTLPILVIIAAFCVQEWRIFRKRYLDDSEVWAMIVEAGAIEQPEHMEDEDYKKKKSFLSKEANRIETKVPARDWTEIEVLSLQQMLVQFLNENELKVRARKMLDDLEDMALDRATSYDVEVYKSWKQRIDDATIKLELYAAGKKHKAARDELEALTLAADIC